MGKNVIVVDRYSICFDMRHLDPSPSTKSKGSIVWFSLQEWKTGPNICSLWQNCHLLSFQLLSEFHAGLGYFKITVRDTYSGRWLTFYITHYIQDSHQSSAIHCSREALQKFTGLLFTTKACLLCHEANKILSRMPGQIRKSYPLIQNLVVCVPEMLHYSCRSAFSKSWCNSYSF